MGLFEVIKYLPEFIRTIRNGEFTGDAVILKSTFGKFEPSEDIREFILSQCQKVPDFSEIEFEAFSVGTFGYAYNSFMQQQGLKPFRFSGRYKHLMSQNYLPVFCASVHDFYHVLTGYDASYAGEAGVWSFVEAQKISPQAGRAKKLAQLFFPLRKPSQRRVINLAIEEGQRMGLSAGLILKMDFRTELSRPLSEVRARYNVVPTSIPEIMNKL